MKLKILYKLEKLIKHLIDEEENKRISKLMKKDHRKVNKINLGCNEADQYGI